MADLRIFSYLPNPRIWKATIAARLNGVDLEVRGAKPSELAGWLWDFDARPLSVEEKGAYASATRVGRVGFKGGSLIKTDMPSAGRPTFDAGEPRPIEGFIPLGMQCRFSS